MAAVNPAVRQIRDEVSLVLDEEWPDGTFGGVRTTRGVPSEPIRCPRPDPHAAAHVAELIAELDLRRGPQRRDRP
ncbi:hypothetical protein [Streptomyces sp. NBC_00842]|uniref:hypothetical protein n=1 Tax=Streptomyces sp. NBC_00842 TaxID=2975848 RepID=UPI0038705B12|nr:hypothetical protein OH821_21950 [Streptomyces sp. NBC_00842]